jgi:hypothetical protein
MWACVEAPRSIHLLLIAGLTGKSRLNTLVSCPEVTSILKVNGNRKTKMNACRPLRLFIFYYNAMQHNHLNSSRTTRITPHRHAILFLLPQSKREQMSKRHGNGADMLYVF